MQRQVIALVAATLLLLLPGPAAAQNAGAAAKVNGVIITRDRLQKSVDANLKKRNNSLGNMFDPTKYKQIRRQVLDVLIGQELLWQETKAKNITIAPQQIARALAEIRSRYASERMFESKLREGGFNEQSFVRDLEHRLAVQRLIVEDIANDIPISDDEIHTFYEANRVRFVRPAEIRARHILVKVARDADEKTRKDARHKIEAILAEARSGTDFAELARQRSEDSSAARGGDLGFFGKGQMVKPFEKVAFGLEAGQISEPVQTAFGYHIIKLEERRDGGQVSEDEARAQIRARLKDVKAEQAIQDRVKRLRKAASIEVLERP